MSSSSTASTGQAAALLVSHPDTLETTANRSNLRVSAGRGLVWSAAERWGGQLLAVVVFTVLARLLDRPVFGAMALANLYIAFVQIFVTQGIGMAVIQRRDLRQSHLDTAFWMNVGAALALAGLTVAFRHRAAGFLGDRDVASVLGWLSLALPLSALSVVPSALLSREMRFGLLARRSLIAAATGGGVGVGAALLGFGVWSLVFQQLTFASLSTALLWSTVSWRPGLKASREALADLAPFSGSVIANDLLWLASQRVDQAFIGRGLGIEALGTYAVSVRLVTFGLDGMAGPSQAVALPLFSGIQEERDRLGRAFLRSTSLMCSVAFPAFIGLLLLSPWLIPFVLGAKWEAAILPLQVLCVAACLRALQTFVHPAMMAMGRTGLYTSLFALCAVVSAIGCWLAATHGVAAVAYAVVIATGVTGVANLVVLSRLLRFSILSVPKTLWPTLAACTVLTVTVLGIQRLLVGHVDNRAIVIVQVALGAFVYAASIAVLDRALWLELRTMSKLFVRP